MKIRAITVGIRVQAIQHWNDSEKDAFKSALERAKTVINSIQAELEGLDYAIQTFRVAFNDIDEWFGPYVETYGFESASAVAADIDNFLSTNTIDFCSLGRCLDQSIMPMLPILLSKSRRFASSIAINSSSTDSNIVVAPDYNICKIAAEQCLQVANLIGDVGNFQFCASFDCPPNTPFFPVAYHDAKHEMSVSIALENGGLLFISNFAAESHQQAKDNLYTTLYQALFPIHRVVSASCLSLGVHYAGIDASINPGLTPQDSAGAGLELLIPNKRPFGDMGTLPAVSATTAALKQLALDTDILITGYSGLMLPVMEDLVLAARAAQDPPTFGLRDLLIFSSICGVGLDTVPIPGDSTIDEIAAIYMEVGTLAYRLKKPLSCRLLPMAGLKAGDMTNVDSPYLCNTKVFSLAR